MQKQIIKLWSTKLSKQTKRKKMSDAEKTTVFSPNSQIKINKWKVREGFQVNNNQLILLYELTSGNDTEIKRLKSSKCGVVKKRFHKEGDIVEAE